MRSVNSCPAASPTGWQRASGGQTWRGSSDVLCRDGVLDVANVEHIGTDPRSMSLTLPPIDRLSSGPARPDALTEFVGSRTRPWGGVPVALSAAVVAALWTIFVLDLGFGSWLLAVRNGVAPCSGFLCWAATLGGHPGTTLLLSTVCAGALAVSVPITRGLGRASGPQLALIVVGALAGVVALSGLFAVLAATALALVLAFGIFVVVVDRL